MRHKFNRFWKRFLFRINLAIHREGTPMARLAALAGIFSPGMVTFGAAALTGAQAFPEVAYGPELARVYARSRVNVSVSSLQMERSMTNRFFDVAAAGGFLLTDWREDLPLALFNAEVAEAISYRSRAELGDKVDFYLHHESRRAELAAALREAVLARHTYQHRAAEVVAAVEGAAA